MDSSESSFSAKSKLYFEVAHDEYADELARVKRLEDKVGRLLAVINILFAAVLAFSVSPFSFQLLSSLSPGLKILTFLLLLPLIVLIFLSWWFLIQASDFTPVQKIPINDSLRSKINDDAVSLDQMYLALGDQCRTAIEASEELLKHGKILHLNRSLFFLKLSVCTLLGYFALIIILKYGEIKVTNIPEQNKESQQPVREVPEYKPEPLRVVLEQTVRNDSIILEQKNNSATTDNKK